MRRTRTSLLALTPAFIAILTMLAPVAALAGDAVGQITSIGVRLDGVKVPSGTTMMSPALVTTGDQPAVVHLSNGQVVNLGPETTAHVTAMENGLLDLSIDEGSAAYLSRGGELITLSSLGTAIFSAGAAGGRAQEIGEGEENEIHMCELEDSNPQKFAKCSVAAAQGGNPSDGECDWEELKVSYDEVGNYYGVNAILAVGQEWEGNTGNDIGLDKDCGTIPLAAWFVSTGVAGGVLGGSVLYDAIDAEETISPVTP